MEEIQRVDASVRALSSILHSMDQGDAPTGKKTTENDVPEYLRYLATLLTTGNPNDDRSANCVLAVTGSLSHNALKAIIVAQISQSPHSPSLPFNFELTPIAINRTDGSFESILKEGYARQYTMIQEEQNNEEASKRAYDGVSSNLKAYISELLGLFSVFSISDRRSLIEFVHSNSMDKLNARLRAGSHVWGWAPGGSLVDVLDAWEIAETDTLAVEHFWVKMLQEDVSIINAIDEGLLAMIKQRPLEAPVQAPASNTSTESLQMLELEFSLQTAQTWTKIIAALLKEMGEHMRIYMQQRQPSTSTTEERIRAQRQALRALNSKIRVLHRMVYNKVMVNALFTIPSLQGAIVNAEVQARFTLKSKREQLSEDEQRAIPDLNPEPYESPGHLALRYLRSIVAWRQAVLRLSQPRYQPLLASMSVHLISTLGSTSSIMTREAFDALLDMRYPDLDPDSKDYELPEHFSSTIHAEAAMMGLMKYLSDSSQPGLVHPASPDVASLTSLPKEAITEQFPCTVGVSSKCCYCCYQLSEILGIRVSGSHGAIYPWACPRVGVSVDNLKKLEDKLWEKLHSALVERAMIKELRSSRTYSPDPSEDLYEGECF